MALDLSAWNPVDHPRDRLGRFRDKWSLSPVAKRMFQAVMRRFAPAEFRSDNHMSAFFRPKAAARARRWSPEQQASLDYYMSPTSSEGMPGWADVNSTLRSGSQDMPQIRHLDSMMAPLDDDMILSRVVGPDAFGLTPEQMVGVEEWTGKLISDKAYISTNYGSPMPMDGPHVEMRILAPKGTKAVMATDGSRSVILDREQPLRITHVTEDGKGGFYVMAVAMPMRGNPEGSRALGRKLAPQEVAPAEAATPEGFQRRGLLPDGTPDPNAPPPPTPEQEEQARAERFGPSPGGPLGNIPEWQNPDRPRRQGSEGSGDAVRDAIDNPNVPLEELRRLQAERREGGGERQVAERLRELERRDADRQRERMERLDELERAEQERVESRIARLEERLGGVPELEERDTEASPEEVARAARGNERDTALEERRAARRTERERETAAAREREQTAPAQRTPARTDAASFEEERARRQAARSTETPAQLPGAPAARPAQRDYTAMNVTALRADARKRGIRGYTRMNREELINILRRQDQDPNAVRNAVRPAKKAAKKAAAPAAPAAPRRPRTTQDRRNFLADLIDAELASNDPDLDRRRGVANAPTPRERLTAARDRLRNGEGNFGNFRDLQENDALGRGRGDGEGPYSRIANRFRETLPDRADERPERRRAAKKATAPATPTAPAVPAKKAAKKAVPTSSAGRELGSPAVGRTNVSRIQPGDRILVERGREGEWGLSNRLTGSTPVTYVSRDVGVSQGRGGFRRAGNARYRLVFRDDNGNEIIIGGRNGMPGHQTMRLARDTPDRSGNAPSAPEAPAAPAAPRLAAKPPAAPEAPAEPNLERMRVADLRALARERGLPALARHRRAELIEMLQNPEVKQKVAAVKKVAKAAPPARTLTPEEEALTGLDIQQMRQFARDYGYRGITTRTEDRYRTELADRIRASRAREPGSADQLLRSIKAGRDRMVARRQLERTSALDTFRRARNRRESARSLGYLDTAGLNRLADDLNIQGLTAGDRRSATTMRQRILDSRTDWPVDYSAWDQGRLRAEMENRFPGTAPLWENQANTVLDRELREDDQRIARGESRDTRIAEMQTQMVQAEQDRQDALNATRVARERQQQSRAHPDGLARLTPTDLRDLAQEWGVPNADSLAYDDLVEAVRRAGGLSPAALTQSAYTRDQLERMTQPQLRTLATHRGLNVANLDSKDDLIGGIASQFRSSNAPPLGEIAAQLRQAGGADARRDLVARHLNGRYGDLDVEITSVDGGGSEFTFNGRIMRNGSPVGTVTRRVHLPNSQGQGGYVYNAYLTVDQRAQGSGFAEEWNNNLFDWYKRSGIDEVRVSANIDVGGYAWATKGFDFENRSTASGMFGSLESQVRDLRQADFDNLTSSQLYTLNKLFGNHALAEWRTPEVQADVIRQLDAADALLARANATRFGRPDYPSAYELSQLGRLQGQGKDDRWIGKGFLLGSSWSGRMYL